MYYHSSSIIALNHLKFSHRSKGPVDCEALKNDLSIQIKKAEEKILNTWYPKVINLFTKKDALDGIKPEKLDSFYNCVSTLLSNQVNPFYIFQVIILLKSM